MGTLTATLKNPSDFKTFLSKFIGLENTSVLLFHNDRIEGRGFYEDTSFFKKSTIYYKDIFEESQFEIGPDPIFVSNYNKINQLSSYLDNFKDGCKFKLEYGELTQTEIKTLLNGWIQNDVVLAGSKIYLAGKVASSVLKLQLNLPLLKYAGKVFDGSDSIIDGYIGTDNENVEILSTFELTDEFIKKVKSLTRSSTFATDLSIDVEEEDVKFSMKDYFSLSIKTTDTMQNSSFVISPKFLNSIVGESYKITIIKNIPTGFFILMDSNESETFCFATAKTHG